MKINETFGLETLRCAAGAMGIPPMRGGGTNMQEDQQGMEPQDPQQTDPTLKAAPYVKLLTKLGYEFQGHDEDLGGGKIGSSFQGPDGDMIMVKPDGSWTRFGPGSQRSQGADANALGQQLVRGAMQEGDDTNHHAALRQSGYNKVHTDQSGTSYYKHPQTGSTVHVTKDGRWGHSSGTGRGAGKLREFLGNESVEQQDPQMQQMKLKSQQMKQQGDMMKKQQKFSNAGPRGTRGNMGTRGGGGGMGGGGGF